MAFHFSRTNVASGDWIAIFYAIAMAVSGTGSLVLGRLFDRFGFSVLIALTLISTLFAPLVFLGDFWLALLGAAIWGLGMGVHESIIPGCGRTDGSRRTGAPRRLGLFTAGYGVFWFLGSAVIGILYDVSLPALIAFCILTQLAAIPIFAWVGRRYRVQDRAHDDETR